MRWIKIGLLTDIPRAGARCVASPHGRIAVFRTSDDQVFAMEDRCPHRGGPLSQGIVHGTSVTCPLHNWVISLETGNALGADDGKVRTIEIKVEGEEIFITPEASASRAA
jgi:nitrite reductase [NAD(P)H] small subunit